MCYLDQFQPPNGLVATHALGHIMYSYTLRVSRNQRVLIIIKLVRVTHDKYRAMCQTDKQSALPVIINAPMA